MKVKSVCKILHVDFNSFFASAEQQANPFLRGKSIGVGGKVDSKGIIAAASKQAKTHGIKTAMSVWKAQKLDPTLLVINGDSRKYGELSRRLIEILKRHGDIVEQTSVDEAFLDVTESTHDWLDALAFTLRVRESIARELGHELTVSVGIAANKLLAKMASDSEKPNGITLVYPSKKEKYAFLASRTLNDIPGIGPAISRRLRELGISSFTSLRQTPLPLLLQHFKSYGYFLYNASRGIDNTPVRSERATEKSIGHSYTLPRHTKDAQIVYQTLLALADRVGKRLRKHALAARSISVVVRTENLHSSMRHAQLSAPTQDSFVLFRAAKRLIDPQKHLAVRLVGITATNRVPSRIQISLSHKQQKNTELLPWLDHIEHRYGRGTWTRAALLPVTIKERINGLRLDHRD